MYDLECVVCFKMEAKCKCGVSHDDVSYYDEADELDFGTESNDEDYEEEELE